MFIYTIPGAPVAQKQASVPKVDCSDSSKKSKEYVRWQIKPYAPVSPVTCPVRVDLTFYLAIPKNTSADKKKQMMNQRLVPICRPYVGELTDIIVSAMKGIIYENDSQVVDLLIHKRYDIEPRTVIRVECVETGQQVSFRSIL